MNGLLLQLLELISGSFVFLAELLPRLAVLALLHLEHLLELLREDVVVHPAVDHVLTVVAVRGEGVLLVQGKVVQVLVRLEQLLLTELDRFGPSAAHLAHVRQGLAGGAAFGDGHEAAGVVFLGDEELPEVLGAVFTERALEVVGQSLFSYQVASSSAEEGALLGEGVVGHLKEESLLDAPKEGWVMGGLLLSTKQSLRSPQVRPESSPGGVVKWNLRPLSNLTVKMPSLMPVPLLIEMSILAYTLPESQKPLPFMKQAAMGGWCEICQKQTGQPSIHAWQVYPRIGLNGFYMVRQMSELPKLDARMAFSWSSGSLAVATGSRKRGQYPKDMASLYMLLSLQKISTGREILRIPLPVSIFLPIRLMIKVSTFFCSRILSSSMYCSPPASETDHSPFQRWCPLIFSLSSSFPLGRGSIRCLTLRYSLGTMTVLSAANCGGVYSRVRSSEEKLCFICSLRWISSTFQKEVCLMNSLNYYYCFVCYSRSSITGSCDCFSRLKLPSSYSEAISLGEQNSSSSSGLRLTYQDSRNISPSSEVLAYSVCLRQVSSCSSFLWCLMVISRLSLLFMYPPPRMSPSTMSRHSLSSGLPMSPHTSSFSPLATVMKGGVWMLSMLFSIMKMRLLPSRSSMEKQCLRKRQSRYRQRNPLDLSFWYTRTEFQELILFFTMKTSMSGFQFLCDSEIARKTEEIVWEMVMKILTLPSTWQSRCCFSHQTSTPFCGLSPKLESQWSGKSRLKILGCTYYSFTSCSWLYSITSSPSKSSILLSSLSMTSSVMVFILALPSFSLLTWELVMAGSSSLMETKWVSSSSSLWICSLKCSILAMSILFSRSRYHYWYSMMLLVPIWKLLNRDSPRGMIAYITQLKCSLFLDLRMPKHFSGYSLRCLEKTSSVRPFSLTVLVSHLPMRDFLTQRLAYRSCSSLMGILLMARSSNSIHRKYTPTCYYLPSFPISFQQSKKSSPGFCTPLLSFSCLQLLRMSCYMYPNSRNSPAWGGLAAETSMNLWKMLAIQLLSWGLYAGWGCEWAGEGGNGGRKRGWGGGGTGKGRRWGGGQQQIIKLSHCCFCVGGERRMAGSTRGGSPLAIRSDVSSSNCRISSTSHHNHSPHNPVLETQHEETALEDDARHHSPQQVVGEGDQEALGTGGRRRRFLHLLQLLQMLRQIIVVVVLALGQGLAPKSISVEGNVNQSTSITIPFQHVVSATVTSQHRDMLAFAPNRFRLDPVKHSQPLPRTNKTLLEELRTPFSNEYTHIFALEDRFLLLRGTNQFLVLRQTSSGFEVQRKFVVSQMTKGSKIHILHKRIMLIFISSKQIVFVTPLSYSLIPNPFNSTSLVFSQVINPHPYDETFVVFAKNTLYVVRTGKGNLTQEMKVPMLPGYDVRSMWIEVQGEKIMFWILDGRVGLMWAKINKKDKKIDGMPMSVMQKNGCYDMDIRLEEKVTVLLTCAKETESWFIKALFVYEKLKPILVKEWKPHIQPCRTSKFIFFKQHIFSLEKQSLDVFLPSLYRGEKELFYIKNWISLSGHSAYWVAADALRDRFFLYSVSNSTFSQWQLILEDYTLYIKSSQQVHESFNLTVEYVCSDKESRVKEICEYETVIEVDIHSKNLSFVQARSVYFGVMLLLATSLLSVWAICCLKYRQIERRALQSLKTITNPTNYKL